MHRSRLIGPVVIALSIGLIGCGQGGSGNSKAGADPKAYENPNQVVLKVEGMT